MKLNKNGNVELYDSQVKNFIGAMESNTGMLKAIGANDPVIRLILGFIKDDMDIFKKHCGIETIKEIES